MLSPDTAVDCASRGYRRFRVANASFLVVNLSFVASWALMLRRARRKLNPPVTDPAYAQYLIGRHYSLKPIKFLFDLYKPSAYLTEPVEM